MVIGATERVLALTVEDLQDWVRAMRRQGHKPGTLRACLGALPRVSRIAGRETIRPDQIVIPHVQEPDPRSLLTLGEVRALLAKLGPGDVEDPRDSTSMVGSLVPTGVRRAEVARIRNDDVEPDRVVIPVGNRRPRVIPWPGTTDAREMVRRLRHMSDKEWMLPGVQRQFRNESRRRGDGGEAARIESLVRLSRECRSAEPRTTIHQRRAATAPILARLDPPVPIPVIAHLRGNERPGCSHIRPIA